MIARKMPRVTVFKCVSLLLWQLIFSNFTEAQENMIKCKVRDRNGIIHLEWIKTNRSLVDEHLPIWIATQPDKEHSQGIPQIKYELKHNFLAENLGDFTLYHDEEKSSTIVYYHKTKLIYGTIDTRYTIRELPRSGCDPGISVGGEFVREHGKWDTDYSKGLNIDLDPLTRHVGKISSSSSTSNQCKPPLKISRNSSLSNKSDPITLNPEILIYIPHDVAKTIKYDSSNDYIIDCVKHYISYFNAVDMLFAKLSTENIKIHINLAGIIIESQDGLLNFKTCKRCVEDTYSVTDNTYRLISQYLKKNRDIFPEDSYDFVFIPTSYMLWKKTFEGFVSTLGLSWNIDSYVERKHEERRLSTLMVQHDVANELIVTTHELAHMMSIEHDSDQCGVYYNGLRCDGKQKVGEYCSSCLTWNEISFKDLEKYVNKNRSHCLLLNLPRSLYAHGTPTKTLSPSDQCRCYGYEFLNTSGQHQDMVSETGCNEILGCDTDGDRVETIMPIDGTPCGDGTVCWNRKCVPESLVTKPEASSSATESFGPHCTK